MYEMKERHQHVIDWRSSGYSMRKYADSQGLHPRTFENWCRDSRFTSDDLLDDEAAYMRTPFTPEERREHVRRWKTSGLSKGVYAQSHDIPMTTFYSWFKERSTAKSSTSTSSSKFVELAGQQTQSAPIHGSCTMPEVHITFPEGMCITITSEISSQQLEKIFTAARRSLCL
jgi:transposase-like protein